MRINSKQRRAGMIILTVLWNDNRWYVRLDLLLFGKDGEIVIKFARTLKGQG